MNPWLCNLIGESKVRNQDESEGKGWQHNVIETRSETKTSELIWKLKPEGNFMQMILEMLLMIFLSLFEPVEQRDAIQTSCETENYYNIFWS